MGGSDWDHAKSAAAAPVLTDAELAAIRQDATTPAVPQQVVVTAN